MEEKFRTPVKPLNQMTGYYGGEKVANTAAHTGNYGIIYALEDSVIATAVGNVSNLSDTALSAGLAIYGLFTSVTLTSGTVMLYNAEEV